jgi:hypothetical protein
MKKTLTLAAALVASAAFAQVSVTYKVDITDYLGAGATLGANGMRVGGNFADQTATVGGNAMVNWSPSDANSAMTDEGNNIWSITVDYPASAVGLQHFYKFVNNDWGTNEGTDPASTIATGGCGVDDGAGNINRTITVPSANAAFLYCFDACLQCDGTSPVLSIEKNEVVALTVSPNPTTGAVSLEFSARAAGFAGINVVNILGQSVMSFERAVEAGVNTLNAHLNVANGTYFVEVTVDGAKSVKRVVVNH